MINKQIETLRAAAKKKSQQTLEKALSAIKEMKDQSISINFESVARYSKTSKTWLYQQPEIRHYIQEQRYAQQSKNIKKGQLIKLNEKENLILRLKKENKKLKAEIQELNKQLEVVYGQLYSKDL